MAYIIGVLEAELHIPLCNSLKEKRSVLRRLENHIRKTHNVSVAEIGDRDIWRTALLGAVTGSTNRDIVQQTLERVAQMIEREDNVLLEHFEIEIL